MYFSAFLFNICIIVILRPSRYSNIWIIYRFASIAFKKFLVMFFCFFTCLIVFNCMVNIMCKIILETAVFVISPRAFVVSFEKQIGRGTIYQSPPSNQKLNWLRARLQLQLDLVHFCFQKSQGHVCLL